jgi:hypothetical protein
MADFECLAAMIDQMRAEMLSNQGSLTSQMDSNQERMEAHMDVNQSKPCV